MTVAALSLLGLSGLTTLILAWRKVSAVATATISALFLAGAAIAAAFTEDAGGFALAATAVLAVVAGAAGGLKVAPLAFYLARRQRRREPDTVAEPLQGGLMIGLLERAAISVAILAGWPEGIAIVLAVKGLARYPELRDPHASEQFIIGTFASVLWAIAAGAIGRGMFG